MNEIFVKPGVEIDLGKRGEHLARCIVFDISGWQKTYGDGSVHLLHQRNGDKAPYPCVVETDGPYVRWLLSETDVDVAGRGRAELQYFVGDARVKSETWNTRTHRSMNNEGPIPEEPAENWLNTMLQLGTETQENAEIAENSAEIAKRSAEMAKDSEAYVAGVVESVVADSLAEIQESVDVAAENAETARASCAVAVESAEAAEASSLSASASEQAAKDAQTAAEQARDEAQSIVGDDLATKEYVGGQIGAHNADKTAHADILERINTLAPEEINAAKVDLSNVSNDVMKAKVEASGFVSGGGDGVESFNGRTGAVVPMAGDYTAEDVGARPNTWMPTAADVGTIPLVESTEHPGCYYMEVNGEKRWLNPPSIGEIEYRTLEFYEGDPVFQKIVNIGYLASGTHKIEHNIPNIGVTISLDVINNGQILVTDYSGITDLYMDRTYIYMTTTVNQGHVAVILKYNNN